MDRGGSLISLCKVSGHLRFSTVPIMSLGPGDSLLSLVVSQVDPGGCLLSLEASQSTLVLPYCPYR